MKIYNKKKFALGAGMLALAAFNLALSAIRRDVDVEMLLLVAALAAFGATDIGRSLSRRMTREDRLEALDERNQLIEYKARSRAFQLMQAASLVLLVVFLVAGKVTGHESFFAMGVGSGVLFSLSAALEIGTFVYYESRN